ncbi:MAG: hypothetical protein OXC60_07495 [Litoreibacter sp.]|nr:hypothetical protein [Litoreibacter sp.]
MFEKKICAITTSVLLSLAASSASATTYSCVVTSFSGHEPLVPKKMVFELSDARVSIRDDIMERVGLVASNAKLDRIVNNEQRFTWKLSPVPRSLKPTGRGNSWSTTALYRASLSTKTKSLKLSGRLLPQFSGPTNELFFSGTGQCELADD